MKTYVFTPTANSDVKNAADYYESCEQGLGERFVHEIRTALHHITQYPEAWPMARCNARRYKVRSFPYLIFYLITGNTIVVVAVMNSRQNPEQLNNRI
jgi:plasmid stabilization system protein ParE